MNQKMKNYEKPSAQVSGKPSTATYPGNSWYLVKRGLYYRPNAAGYTCDILEAGIFSEAIAKSHVSSTAGEKSVDMRVKMVLVPAGKYATETDLRVQLERLQRKADRCEALEKSNAALVNALEAVEGHLAEYVDSETRREVRAALKLSEAITP